MNSFDQWGVELGKQLALPILGALTGGTSGAHELVNDGIACPGHGVTSRRLLRLLP